MNVKLFAPTVINLEITEGCNAKCLICSSDHCQTLSKHYVFNTDSLIVRCASCGFIFSTCQLNDAELLNFYQNQYRSVKKENLDFVRKCGDLERAISQYDFIKNHLALKDSILEIGAGWAVNANFLYHYGYRDYTVIEPDDDIMENLAPSILRKSTLVDIKEEKYNFIIMSHLLEHLYTPREKLCYVKSLLKPHGRVFVEVPNAENNSLQKLFSSDYHFWFFAEKHLVALFNSCGFKKLKIGVFGKELLLSDLTDLERRQYARKVSKGEANIIELNNSHLNAYWLRGLFELSS